MILITRLDLIDENLIEFLMVIMSFTGLLGLIVSIFTPFETDIYKEKIVVIIVSLLCILCGSIYSNFILFRSFNCFFSYFIEI